MGVSSSKTYSAVNHEDGPVAVSVVAAWTRTAPLIGPGWLAIETPAPQSDPEEPSTTDHEHGPQRRATLPQRHDVEY